MKKDKMVSSIMEFALEVDEKIILAKAIERYGDDPFKFGGQRDGFLEGYKAAFIEIKGVAPTKNKKTSKHSLHNVEVRLFDPKLSKPNASSDDPAFSEDVCVLDQDGLNGLAYFSFKDDAWRFLTAKLVDYNEVGDETKWMWYYPVVKVTDINW